jgi:pimeloyl-ACP methyl ester carboxylesterase
MPGSSPAASPGVVEPLGGREVHWGHQVGDPPAVVLLGGCGVPSHIWDDVVARLPGVELALLDRPGLGGTAWPGSLPRLSQEVATLVDLIKRLGASALLVGHSMAGLHAEALARQHPDLVAGLVLVDGSVEWQPKRPGSKLRWLAAARVTRALLAVALLRPLGSLADRVLTAAQSRRRILDSRSTVANETYRSRDAVASAIAENAAYDQQVWDLDELRKAAPFPTIPVVVLTAAADGGPQWVDDQRKLADLLAGRQVVAGDSRHMVMIDRPDLVADAIGSVRLRAGGQ